MMRAVQSGDTSWILGLAAGTGVFKPIEIQALREVLDDFHASNHAAGHGAAAYERDGQGLGFVYFAPAAMTDRTWYLYWIAVAKAEQAHGIGGVLLQHVESYVREAHGRLLLIETSSLPHYEPTRRFYTKQGYERSCVVHDFYADGDDLVVFRKRLAG